jgi:hypothetical protein
MGAGLKVPWVGCLGPDCLPVRKFHAAMRKPQAAIRPNFSGNGIRIEAP